MAEQEKEILEEEQTAARDESPENEEAEVESKVTDGEAEGTDSAEDSEGADDTEEDTAAEDAPEGEDPKTWAEKRAAKKQAKQDKKADAYKEQIAQLEDKVKRQLAEFENFRNRTEKEKQAMFEVGARSVIEKILPVIDNFERGFATVEPEDKEDAFVDGMQRVYKQLMTELDSIGVKPIEAVGKEFDPNLHNAVMQVASEEYETGTVAQELQKGYMYRDTVVRHSMVSVVE
ncbi:MAG: nucleotide exchange factor GrpE [Acetatifactor sp.]